MTSLLQACPVTGRFQFYECEYRFRTPLLAGLLVQCAMLGCAHTPRQMMSDLRSSAPQARRTKTDTLQEPKPAEPSAIANAAIPSGDSTPEDQGNQDTSETATLSNRSFEKSDVRSTRIALFDSRQTQATGLTGGQADTSATKHDSTDGQPVDVAQAGSNEDNIERLKAALDEDAQITKEPTWQFGGAHDVRVRVESLLERAKRLFDSGRLREARHTAQVAQDMGETARLDFLPEEERPVDLVHRIEDQIQVETEDSIAGTNGEPENMGVTTLPSDAIKNPSASTQQTRPASGSDDAANRARSRRDWSQSLNVFRWDRKPNVIDSVPSQIPTNVELSVSQSVAPQIRLELELDSEQGSTSGTAVVQANRSYTRAIETSVELEKTTGTTSDESGIETSMESIGPNTPDNMRERQTSSHLLPPDTESTASFSGVGAVFAHDTQTGVVDESSPPELDEVRPIARFHDVDQKQAPKSAESCVVNQAVIWPWAGLTLSIGFGICGLFAIFWYQRGAT